MEAPAGTVRMGTRMYLEIKSNMKLIQLFSFSLMLLSCSGELRVVNGPYYGFWGETSWTFDFKINGTYTLDVEGQAGDFLTAGKFVTTKNIVLLIQDSAYLDVINLDRLVKTENGCLKDMDGHYYCKTEEKRQEAMQSSY